MLRHCLPREIEAIQMMERKALQKKGEQLIVKKITPMVKLIKSIIPSREYEIMKEEEVKPIMEQLKERINPELAETQKHRILSVLDRHQKAFSMNSQDIEFVRADLCPITIDISVTSAISSTLLAKFGKKEKDELCYQ